jgi:hypothetical protein
LMRPDGENHRVAFGPLKRNNHRGYRSLTTKLYGRPRFANAYLGQASRAKPLLAFANRETKLSKEHLKRIAILSIEGA